MELPLNPEYPYYLAEADLVELTAQMRHQDEAHWELFLGFAERRTVSFGEILIRQFDGDRDVYVLTEGTLEVRAAAGPQAMEEQLAIVEPIAIVGEQSFLDDGPRTATIAARGEATVYRLNPAAFDDLRRQYPDIACAFLFDLARSLSQRARGLRRGRYLLHENGITTPGISM